MKRQISQSYWFHSLSDYSPDLQPYRAQGILTWSSARCLSEPSHALDLRLQRKKFKLLNLISQTYFPRVAPQLQHAKVRNVMHIQRCQITSHDADHNMFATQMVAWSNTRHSTASMVSWPMIPSGSMHSQSETSCHQNVTAKPQMDLHTNTVSFKMIRMCLFHQKQRTSSKQK